MSQREPSIGLTTIGAAAAARRRRSAFTLIELLIVIFVIGVLATVLVAVAVKVHSGQKASATRNTMRLIRLAIDQFAEENPLQVRYDNPRARDGSVIVGKTFGPFPPYQLARHGHNSVSYALEPNPPTANSLSERLFADLGNQTGSIGDWVDLNQEGEYAEHDDNRALYTYFAAFSSGVLSQIPDTAMERLVPDDLECINPGGAGTGSNAEGRVDVLGFVDAWGVPFDYFLQVKLEYGILPDGVTQGWRVTDRVPVLRSRGVAKEVVGTANDLPGEWIFSEPLPQPVANVNLRTGAFLSSGSNANGWARAVAGWNSGQDDYRYFADYKNWP